MGRPTKQKAEYFPHFVASSKTKRILQSRWKNDGYAFWFKLLELLCDTEGHCLDLNNSDDWNDFLAVTAVPENTALEILEKLSTIGNIDYDLWQQKYIWCQSLVDNLAVSLYKRRTVSAPKKPVIVAETGVIVTETPENVYRNPQREVKRSKEKRSKEKNKDSTANEPVDNSQLEDLKTPIKTPDFLKAFSLFFQTFRKQKNQQETLDIYQRAIELGVKPEDLLKAASKYRVDRDSKMQGSSFDKPPDAFIRSKEFIKYLPKHNPNCPKCHGEDWVETDAGMAKCDCKNPYEEIKF